MFAYPDAELDIHENEERCVQWLLAGTFADEPAQEDFWLLDGATSRFPLRFTAEPVGEVPPEDYKQRVMRDFAEMREVARGLESDLIDFEV
jgi:hypothetical protein